MVKGVTVVHFVGRPSWSLHVGGPAAALEQALYVRDAADLPVADTSDPPGRLVDLDLGVARMLSAAERRTAGQQWPQWWRACIDLTVLRTLADGPLVGSVWHEELNQAPTRVGEPPRWEALADRPELHKAVLLCQSPSEHWRRERAGPGRGEHRGPHQDVVAHSVLASLAERVIRDHGVAPDRVNARVLLVSAAGVWWRRVWPGIVVTTREALADEASYLEMVEDAFTSGL